MEQQIPRTQPLTRKEKINELVGRYKWWIVVFELVVILGIGWVFALQSAFFDLRDAQTVQYQNSEAERSARQDTLRRLQQMEQAYGELNQERIYELSQIVPETRTSSELLTMADRFATDAGLTLVSADVVTQAAITESGAAPTTPTPAETEGVVAAVTEPSHGSLQRVTVALTLQASEASYEEFRAFIETLDTFTPIVNMYAIQYTPGADTYAIQFDTYMIEL